MPKILEGSQRALTGEELEFAIKNAENMKKPFEQRYAETIAQCKEENMSIDERIEEKLSE